VAGAAKRRFSLEDGKGEKGETGFVGNKMSAGQRGRECRPSELTISIAELFIAILNSDSKKKQRRIGCLWYELGHDRRDLHLESVTKEGEKVKREKKKGVERKDEG